ncbi:MAG: hypothetical protein ACR2HH_16355 [Chthoniobacterales bacterium]
MAEGQIPAVLSKHPTAFGAPFVANWNDYPSVEEGVSSWCALLAYMFGLFPGQNLEFLSAHLLAAGAFYFVCRRLRYDKRLSAAGALLFSFSHYAQTRNVSHLGLTFYWHIPLGLLVVWWCLAKAPFHLRSRKGFLSIVIAILYGIQNPYYTGIFLQFLAWAALICLVQKRGLLRILRPLQLSAVVFMVFFVMNIDTFYNNHLHGSNPTAVTRNYSGLETYALKPVELFLPLRHRVAALGEWTKTNYLQRALFTGETNSVYLGIVGILCFALLAWKVAKSVARPRETSPPGHFWPIAWVLFYSVVGGVNGLIGLFGIVLFRGTNRYSIVILTLLLLFGVRELTRYVRSHQWSPLAIFGLSLLLAAIGLWDQTTQASNDQKIAEMRTIVHRDEKLVKTFEARLPKQAMIFQLPVMDFPEAGPLLGLSDYDEFRPYLHSKTLRYSYGAEKGRSRDDWQHVEDNSPVPELVRDLEQYGFAAILIARRGYLDGGEALMAKLGAAGRGEVLATSNDFVCVRLQPSLHPFLPPNFASGWSGREFTFESSWRWSSGNAEIIFENNQPTSQTLRLNFRLVTLQDRQLTLSLDANKLKSLHLTPARPETVELDLTMQPGENHFRLITDVPGEKLATGDPRILAYQLRDFSIEPR